MAAPYVCSRLLVSDRRRSEDRAEVFERGDALIVVIADGAGGVRGGAVASEALVDKVRAVVHDAAVNIQDVALWTTVFTEVDAALTAKTAGETTGVVVVLGLVGLVGVSAGDSEAWIVTANAIDDLTARQMRARLGSGQAAPVGFRRAALGGVLVVGTDGLFKYALPERIAEAVRGGDVEGAGDRLGAVVRLASGGLQDDVGVVVVGGR
jgi:hypothetical protein